MTSLLAFSWRRRLSPVISSADERRDLPDPASPLPPVVSASQSGDTQSNFEEHQQYIMIGRQYTPTTPDGLQPRKTTLSLRTGLGIPQNLEETSSSIAVLPPRPCSSWSTQAHLSSPPVSTSSFYSRTDGNQSIAESPHLLPGQARTAVGAIVALQQNLSSGWPQEPNQLLHNDYSAGGLGPLPRRTDWGYFSPTVQRNFNNEEESVNENEEPQYYALDNEPTQNAPSPFRMFHTAGPLLDSPITAKSSLAGSPSSRVDMQHRLPDKAKNEDTNKSFSSQVGLINLNKSLAEGYDFAPLILSDNANAKVDVVLTSDEAFANMSAMSQSAIMHEHEPRASRIATDENSYMHTPNDQRLGESSTFPQLDGALRKTKSQNQQRAKEELVLMVATRLRDDLQLIAEIEEVDSAAFSLGDWFMKTPFDKDGLLTGISRDKRIVICRRLSTVLDEMNIAQPEEFFLSPSMMEQYGETHDDLRNALLFCRTLVQKAIPDSERHENSRGNWKFLPEVRSALGVVPVESPAIERGGDTSQFSLPSECADTPMTSNVSLTTTITSAVTSPYGSRHRQSRSTPDGLVVRRAIELFATLFQKLTISCLELAGDCNKDSEWTLSAMDSLRITENIKRTYLQLLALEQKEMHAIVDSFNYDPSPLEITRGQGEPSNTRRFVLPPPPDMLRTTRRSFNRHRFASQNNPEEKGTARRHEQEANMFSPGTEDMRTYVPPQEADDDGDCDNLRRQLGTVDDAPEARDAVSEYCVRPELRE